MRKQQEEAAEEKEKAIEARVPKLQLDGLDQSQCQPTTTHNQLIFVILTSFFLLRSLVKSRNRNTMLE